MKHNKIFPQVKLKPKDFLSVHEFLNQAWALVWHDKFNHLKIAIRQKCNRRKINRKGGC